jgi:hypothetical protein
MPKLADKGFWTKVDNFSGTGSRRGTIFAFFVSTNMFLCEWVALDSRAKL